MTESAESDDRPEVESGDRSKRESGDSPENRPKVVSRQERLIEYLDHNSDQILVDVTILLAWLLGTTVIFGILGLPSWLHYLILFIGIVAYSRVTPTWRRPYRSPD